MLTDLYCIMDDMRFSENAMSLETDVERKLHVLRHKIKAAWSEISKSSNSASAFGWSPDQTMDTIKQSVKERITALSQFRRKAATRASDVHIEMIPAGVNKLHWVFLVISRDSPSTFRATSPASYLEHAYFLVLSCF